MKRRIFTPVRIALIFALLFAFVRFQNPLFLRLLDVRLMDFRLLTRGPIAPQPQVVIVAVDDESLAKVGRWVWPRAIIADLLRRITAAEPLVVALDIVFSEPSDFQERDGLTARPPGISPQEWKVTQASLRAQDQVLADAIRESGRIVLGYALDLGSRASQPSDEYLTTYNLVRGKQSGATKIANAPGAIVNLPEIEKEAVATGYFNVIPDAFDGGVRRMPLAMRYKDEMRIPLGLAALKAAIANAPLELKLDEYGAEYVRFGPMSIPVAEDAQLLINYRGPGKTFPHISAASILNGEVAPEQLRGKIVLIGVTATAVLDIRVTPFDEIFPGVETHANVIDNILTGDFIHQPKWLVVLDIAALLILTMLLGAIMIRARGVAAALSAITLLAAYLVVSQMVFLTRGWPLAIIYPVLAVVIAYVAIALQHYLTEERERKKMRSALDVYLSPSMAELLSRHPERLQLGGDNRELTVFFSDIRGFTTLTERLDPEVLSEILNEYLGDMTDIVFAHDGMLDKYIGDAVMAVWGAPLPQADHARRACLATFDMVERLPELNKQWQARGLPPMAIGCGLNTGQMKFGNYGSAQHMAITVIGDNVNLGSRLEGLTKMYHTDIIAAESTVIEADGAVVARELDLVRVKGKAEPVRIFQLLGRGEHAARWAELVDAFAKGVDAYRTRRWQDALAIFEAIVEKRPDDGPSHMFIERCRALLASPPDTAWDPVTTMETK
jgi:adenylate cyclase